MDMYTLLEYKKPQKKEEDRHKAIVIKQLTGININ